MQIPTRIAVRRMIVDLTGTYHTQFMRPYDNTLQGPGLDVVCEQLAGEQHYTAARLAGVANQIVSPTADPEKPVSIVNGWGTPRCRFVIEVETHHMGGGVSVANVLGYTDHIGISGTNGALRIDPNLEFYVNSVVQIREYLEATPLGNQVRTDLAENSHVLVDPGYFDAYVREKTTSMRPEDLYATMSLSHLSGMGDTFDTRTTLTKKPVASNRTNSIAAFYAADVLENYRKAADSNNFGLQPETHVLDSARGYASTNLLEDNAFFRAMKECHDGLLTNFFTWKDLCRIDPDVIHKVKQAEGSPQVHQMGSGMSEQWGGSNRLTQVATILAQSVPALMSAVTLSKLSFTATNREVFTANAPSGTDIRPNFNFVYSGVRSFLKGDLSNKLGTFRINLEHMILNDISHRNQIDYFMRMTVDLLGETWIELSLDGGPLTPFVVPSFADALMVPVITTQTALSQRLSGDFHEICTSIANYDGMSGIMPPDSPPASSPFAPPPKPRFGRI